MCLWWRKFCHYFQLVACQCILLHFVHYSCDDGGWRLSFVNMDYCMLTTKSGAKLTKADPRQLHGAILLLVGKCWWWLNLPEETAIMMMMMKSVVQQNLQLDWWIRDYSANQAATLAGKRYLDAEVSSCLLPTHWFWCCLRSLDYFFVVKVSLGLAYNCSSWLDFLMMLTLYFSCLTDQCVCLGYSFFFVVAHLNFSP